MNGIALQTVENHSYVGGQLNLTLIAFVVKQIRWLDSCKEYFDTVHVHSKKQLKQTVLPGLEYCSSIWDPTQISFIYQLEMVKHKAAHFVLNHPSSKLYWSCFWNANRFKMVSTRI